MTRRQPLSDYGLDSFEATTGTYPIDYYDRLRRLGPVVWDDNLGCWLITGYDAVRQVLRTDQEDWGVADRMAGQQMVGLDAVQWKRFMGYESKKTLNTDDVELHNHMHRWWMRTFSGRGLEHLGDTLVRPVAHAQIDRFVARGSAELYEEFANRVAPRVIASAMGLPWRDDEWLDHVLSLHVRRIALISHKTLLQRSGAAPDETLLREGYAAVETLAELARPYVRERRDGTGEDFISLVWRDADALFGDSYSEEDVIGTANIAFAGGSGTTAAATSAGLYLLMNSARLQAELRVGGTGMMRNFVEETLRLFPSLNMTTRIALRDLELSGVRIEAGEMIMILTGAANSDPQQYAEPLRVDVTRRAPKDHFTFMKGPLTCPGQGLARTQLTTIFSVVLERLTDLRFDPAALPPRYTDPFIRRWRPLNAQFTSAR
jgi:cytochrome P450